MANGNHDRLTASTSRAASIDVMPGLRLLVSGGSVRSPAPVGDAATDARNQQR
jgi:hypothetical protein